MNQNMFNSIKNELLNNILPYWEKFARDTENKGFYGSIDNTNRQNEKTDRTIVMTSRFLWAYSAAARFTKNPRYLEMADFAYDVILTKYFDKQNGGVYWSVTPQGSPAMSKKQIYGEAFCCYGLSEYAAAVKELRENGAENASSTAVNGNPASVGPNSTAVNSSSTPASHPLSVQAMEHAISIFNLMEEYALDLENGGYVEARAVDWNVTDDMALSSKDMNCPKSMNTNLHVMEAYTNLYRNLPVVYGDLGAGNGDGSPVFPASSAVAAKVKSALTNLVRVTVFKILQKNGHLGMFFDMNWNTLSDEISYGHDIECSWLLWEAACELGDGYLKSEIRDTVLFMAKVALEEGVDKNSGAMENLLVHNGTVRDRTRVWWVQAESLNGFYNAWEMTGDNSYANAVQAVWKWIEDYQIDREGGEWWAELDVKGKLLPKEDKGGNWKTPYHSARACMELLRRSNNM